MATTVKQSLYEDETKKIEINFLKGTGQKLRGGFNHGQQDCREVVYEITQLLDYHQTTCVKFFFASEKIRIDSVSV